MLASDTYVTPHFQAWELGLDKPEATADIVARMTRVANTLEKVRTLLGNVPLVMGTRSGFRTAADNAAVGGSPTSSHLTGDAADFTPKGVTLYRAYRILQDALATGKLPEVDQVIYYSYDGHIHIGLGSQRRQQVLIQLKEGGAYLALTQDLIAKLPGYAVSAIAEVSSTFSALGGWVGVLALAVLAFVLIRL